MRECRPTRRSNAIGGDVVWSGAERLLLLWTGFDGL
ncbi:hypothetical protein XHC_4409 [Xanthomonas hortorum pv. carotae str. M081]|nr:hypothetical protein XHC_4409 [Xanthomonas hortorum pv. carotae str. M081]